MIENVKEKGTQYFSFAENAAVSSKPVSYDLALSVQQRTAEVGQNSCLFFNISTDPIIKAGPGLTIARLDSVSLEDVSQVPQASNFLADDTLRNPFIRKNWFDPQNGYQIRPDVYVLKSCSGNYGLIQVKRYDFDFTNMQISNIVVQYRYNADGSADFSQTVVDSFDTGNGYEETRYISLSTGPLNAAYGSWDIQLEGSSIWLGPGVSAHRMENTEISAVGDVTNAEMTADHLPFYQTTDWYDTDA